MILIRNKKMCDLRKLSSKEIREISIGINPICVHKLGCIMTPSEALNWGEAVRRISSTKHKSILLRTAHGDIYTKEKLNRFGLSPSPFCPRCEHVETLSHKLYECEYAKRIWEVVTELTSTINPRIEPIGAEDWPNKIMGVNGHSDPLVLAIHSETILKILSLKDDTDFLIRPKILARIIIRNIRSLEKKEQDKRRCQDLLDVN